jgi:RecA-family ATPase
MPSADAIRIAKLAVADFSIAQPRNVEPAYNNAPMPDAYPESADGEPDYGLAPDAGPATAEEIRPAPASLITPTQWPTEAPPPVDWLAHQRIPRGDVTTLHGDGGAGKTDIAIHLAESCARGAPYWLGHEIARGKVVIVSAEEPERELRRRTWMHGQRDGFSADDLSDLHLWFPDDVAGAVFAVPDRTGIMRPTPLFRSIEAAIAEVAPILVIVDNVAATFTGNQNDRVMVRSYVNLWRTVARQPNHPAVLLLDHPSLSGLTSGSGRGGNMDWRNAVRSALYLRVPDEKAEADQGVRILETAKSNYGPTGNPVRLQWGDGGLAIERAQGSLVRLAEDSKVDDLFMRLLDKRNAQGRPVRPSNGPGYAPAEFQDDTEAGGIRAKAFKTSMERLLTAKKIVVITSGPPSKSTRHIERAPQ